jgi:hypothetical protein
MPRFRLALALVFVGLLAACSGGGSSFSGGGTAPVPVAPQITSQPVSATVTQGATVTFSVSATGSDPLSFQWKKNGTAVTGTGSSVLQITSAQAADAGTYLVVVSNSVGSATSNPATLVVNPPPLTISAQPASLAVTVGQPAIFSVTVSGGTAPFAYQWKKNGNAVGTSSSTFSIAGCQFGDAAAYTVTVTDSAPTPQTVSSASAILMVNPPALAIGTQPASQAVTLGQNASFTIVASGGTPPCAYQWRKGAVNLGSNSPSLALSNVQFSDAGTYAVTVTDASPTPQSVTSIGAVLTVNPTGLAIATQPTTQTVTVGQPVSFAVAASGGTPPYAYQWKKGTQNIGVNTPTLNIPSVQMSDAGTYTVVVTDNSPTRQSTTSNAATLTVNPTPLLIISQPASATVAVGASASFTVAVSGGTAPYTYQWKKGGANTGSGGATLGISNAQLTDAGTFFVTVTDSSPTPQTVISATATLTVTTVPPSITTQPANQTVAVGSTATFSVVATGTAPMTYQWYKNGVAGGMNNSSYSFTTVAGNHLASIYVKVSNAKGNLNSNTATLTLTGLPTLDLTVGKVQLNQAIQMADDSVPIIRGRGLIFQVYPMANQANTIKPVVKVDVYNAGVLVQSVSGTFPNSNVPLTVDLSSTGLVELLVSGSSVQNGYTYTVTVDPNGVIPEINKNNNTSSGTFNTVTVHSLPINMVPLKIGTVTALTTTLAEVQAMYGKNLMSRMPVSTINYTCAPIYTVSTPVVNPAALSMAECGAIVLELENKRLAESSGVLYVGLYYSNGAQASGMAFVPGWTSIVQNPSNAMEHEITHNLGEGHVNCPGFTPNSEAYPHTNGLVMGNGVAVAGYSSNIGGSEPKAATRYDYMTYCNPTWTSDWTYKRCINWINTKGFAGASSIVNRDQVEGESLLVSGSYEVQNGNWSLEPAFTLGSYSDPNEENWDGNGLEVRVLDAGGQVLARKNIRLGVYCELLNVPFRHFATRFNGNFEGAAEIQVVENGKVVASQKSSESIDEPLAIRSSDRQKAFAHRGQAAMVMNEKGEVLTILRNGFDVLETPSEKFTIHVSNGVRSRKFERDLR